jgi:hypothetical protein
MRLYFVEQALRFVDALREAEQASGRKYFPITVLMSYWTLKNKNLADYLGRWVQRDEIILFVDSGAYSAFTQYQTIDVNAYGNWLTKNLSWIDCYANLDVKESWQKSAANLSVLQGMGLSPMPVYHMGEPLTIYQDMLAQYPDVALGGMVGATKSIDAIKQSIRWHAYEAIKAKKRLHLFGIGSYPILMEAPAFSADSSTYIGYRWGKVNIFDETKLQYVRFQVGDPRIISYEHYFTRFGLPSFPAVMKRAKTHATTYLRAFEYLNMKRAEEYLTAIWGVRMRKKP